MADADIHLKYTASDKYSKDFAFKGMRCPRCGIIFLPEDMAVGRLATAEGMAEGK